MSRTLIVATTSYAGMGPYVSEIVNGFSAEDDVWFLFRDYEDCFFQKNIKEELHAHSFFYKSPNSKWNKLKDLVWGYDFLFDQKILNLSVELKIDLVHFINGPANSHILKKLNKRKICVLGTIHDLQDHEMKKAWYKMLRYRVGAYRRKKALEKSSFLVTNGKKQYDELNLKFPEKNIYFHGFPSLVTKSVLLGKNVPPELGKIDKKNYILFFGRIEEYKGLRYLYEVFTSHPELHENYKLVVAGSGSLNIDRKKDEHNVLFLNRYIKDSEISYLYQNARCCVYPYVSATQSGVLSIAFFYKTPTLASDVPFFKEIIEPTGAGMLFETANLNSLYTNLMALLRDDADKIGDREFEFYKNNYDASTIRRDLLNIYGNVFQSGGAK